MTDHNLPAKSAPRQMRLTVTKTEQDSSNIKSFWLSAIDCPLPTFVPGEYMVFEVPAGPNGRPEKREYSISGVSADGIRVSIKRETCPPGAPHPDGLVSTFFHDKIAVGDPVSAFGPTGKFLLDRESERPVVLLSGGVGQTPLVAMAHHLAIEGTRPTQFIHACEHGDVHALRDEMERLADTAANIKLHFVYRTPTDDDRQHKRFDSEGFVTKALLQSVLPLDDYEFYLCGPGPFMQAMYQLLLSLGVEDADIRYEFFGPATILKSTSEVNAPHQSAQQPPTAVPSDATPKVIFAKSGIEAAWDPSLENLLDFAEENGLMPDFSCRAGTCDSCKTKVLSGTSKYIAEPMEKPDGDFILLCCSAPKDDLILDL